MQGLPRPAPRVAVGRPRVDQRVRAERVAHLRRPALSKQRSRFHQIVSGHLRSARGQLLLGLFFLAGSSAMTLLEPWPFKIVVDYLLLAKPLPHQFAFLSGLLQGDAIT